MISRQFFSDLVASICIVPSPKDQCLSVDTDSMPEYIAVIFCHITLCLFSARSEQLVLLLLLLLLLFFSVICSIPGELCCLYLLLSCGEWINARVGQLICICFVILFWLKVSCFTNKQKSFICCLTHWKEERKEEKKRTKKEVGKSNTQRFVVVITMWFKLTVTVTEMAS